MTRAAVEMKSAHSYRSVILILNLFNGTIKVAFNQHFASICSILPKIGLSDVRDGLRYMLLFCRSIIIRLVSQKRYMCKK